MTAATGSEDHGPMPSPQELAGLLPFLSVAEVENLLPYLAVRHLAAGEVLMQEGDPAECMGFLMSGRLAVKKQTSFEGRYILVAVIEPGGLVGELAVVEKGRRTATVAAMEESRLLVLPHEGMSRLLAEDNPLAVKLFQRIIHVLGHRLRGASERLARIL